VENAEPVSPGKRRILRTAVLAATVVVLAVLAWTLFAHRSFAAAERLLSMPDSPSRPFTKEEMVILVKASARDSSNVLRMRLGRDNTITRAKGYATGALFPARFIREGIIHKGKDRVFEPLLAIAQDPAQPPDVAWEALRILMMFDDPRVIDIMAWAASDPNWSQALPVMMQLWLPISFDSPLWQPGLEAQWFRANIAGKEYQDVLLTLLDSYLRDPRLPPGDSGVLRFLGRHYDAGFEEQLATIAPDTLAFYNREVAKGYEPIWALNNLDERHHVPGADRAIASLLPDPNDQKALTRIFNLYHTEPASASDETWRSRLIEWYTANRDKLRYDMGKHRFVLPGAEQPLALESSAVVPEIPSCPSLP